MIDLYSDYNDARQHLNLSSTAFETIESDKYEFFEKPSREGLINLILSTYMDDADAAIDKATFRYREKLEAELQDITEGVEKRRIIDKLVALREEKLGKKATSYPKEHPFKTRLDKYNYSSMMEWRDKTGYYNDVPGNFIKAVIEEYASKSFYEREGIILRNKIEELKACIAANQLIVLTINGNVQKRYEVKPYLICADSDYNYHYLVGMSRRSGTENEEMPVSFRISRITNIKHSFSRSGKTTVEQKQRIDERLKTSGVQFMLGETETIRIRLTEQGKKLYDSVLHLRPPFVNRIQNEDASWIYTFNCTSMQAEFYFFKFGADAVIEYPDQLREKFKDNYRSAVEAYGR